MKYEASTPQNPINDWVFLIIDDMPDNIAVAQAALEFHGARVHTARNGESGLAMLATLQPTVILLDIRMPRMNGWQVFDAVRNNNAYEHIPIIAITAYAMDKDREEAMRRGFDGFVTKPFDIFSFVYEIEQLTTQAIAKRQSTQL